MQKLYSEIIGMPVLTEYSDRPSAFIQDIIIDPENGSVLAFRVKRNHIIVPYDVESIGRALIIADSNRILPIAEVLRVENVFNMNINIIGARVITEKEKIEIGHVVDYEINTTTMSLTKIHSAKTFLFFRFNDRIISYKNIVKINKHSILIKESLRKVTQIEKTVVPESAFAA